MAKPKKTPGPVEPIDPTPLEIAAGETPAPEPVVVAAPKEHAAPASGPRKNAPSGAKRLVHNGVVVDVPDTVKRKATMLYDGTSAEVSCPRDMDWETFRAYIDQAASEFSQALDERNRRSKQSKAAERLLVEARTSMQSLTPDLAGGGEIYARMVEQKSVDVARAQARARDAATMLQVQDALIEDAKRRWLNAA